MPFKKMFQDIEENLKKSQEGLKSMSEISGQDEISIKFDNNAHYHKEKSEQGNGITLYCTAKIVEPKNKEYSLNITSSANAGSGGVWENLKSDEEVKFTINTNVLPKSTTVSIDIQGQNIANMEGKALYTYSSKKEE